ncbi:uncharacterized protein F4812DRAFT_369626 [Daldinia caldariorum]|uniref:uncharacterized protein n=1 Tax=Daldinia caldariorum TaxID=326644 RepID=UPI00200737F2|nr:uncharacterized protein F4812DRAFT_369626 [Daldinia caldariorum]KAI1468454.1 hypothetical protein F4812DRAFT_369626 [Daldinia caldariorum]
MRGRVMTLLLFYFITYVFVFLFPKREKKKFWVGGRMVRQRQPYDFFGFFIFFYTSFFALHSTKQNRVLLLTYFLSKYPLFLGTLFTVLLLLLLLVPAIEFVIVPPTNRYLSYLP